MKVVSAEPLVHVVSGAWSPEGLIREAVAGGQEDPFYIMDLAQVVQRYHRWRELMPTVEPFYAVKCNDDPVLVRTLAALGAGFDCASKAEIQLVTGMGVRPERIIFANPAKMASHIRYASSAGVLTMTFDSETELLKVKQIMPHAQLVIRIRCDAASAQCPLGIKFGCDPAGEAPRLLKLAAVLGLDVVGVSFHVGSGAQEAGAYVRGLQYCRALVTLGEGVGLRMRLVDIGGGFPGGAHQDILDTSRAINEALATHFPPSSGVRVIAEPGRYFATAAYTLATLVYAKRELPQPAGEAGAGAEAEARAGADGEGAAETHTMYFINDGVYGSFNCVLYDHQHVTPALLEPCAEKPLPCSVWGPSCDGLDCVLPAALLPPLGAGAWLVWRDMGAYTLPVASPFNGFPTPTVRHVVTDKIWAVLKELWPFAESHFTVEAPPTPPPSPPAVAAPPAPDSPPPPPAHCGVFVECALK